MIRTAVNGALATFLAVPNHPVRAAEEEGHHASPNRIALVAGLAFEEQADGHREHGF